MILPENKLYDKHNDCKLNNENNEIDGIVPVNWLLLKLRLVRYDDNDDDNNIVVVVVAVVVVVVVVVVVKLNSSFVIDGIAPVNWL